MKTKKIILISIITALPILIVIEMILFNQMTELINQPSDVAFLAGIALLSVLIGGNIFLGAYLAKKLIK